jgi:uncharacterized protein YigE (DUF2233 family)
MELAFRQQRSTYRGLCFAILFLSLGGVTSLVPHRTLASPIVSEIHPSSLARTDLQVQQQLVAVGDWQGPAAVVAVNLQGNGLRLRPFWASPNQLTGILDTPAAATRQGAIAAINAGFFNRDTQQPLGAIRRDGRWISGPILGRGIMAWNDAGEFLFARMRFQEEVHIGQSGRAVTLPIADLNSAYLQSGFARYTLDWGYRYTTQTDGEVVTTVVNGAIAAIREAQLAGSLEVSIPPNGYLLVARQSEAVAQARQFRPGDVVEGVAKLDPLEIAQYPHAIGGGPLLLQAGEVVLDAERERFQPTFAEQRAARSAVGRLADGRLLLVAAGKGEENSGLTLAEMALLMQQLGCVDALNLDGGTSSTLYANGAIANFAGDPPRVNNYLGIFPVTVLAQQ